MDQWGLHACGACPPRGCRLVPPLAGVHSRGGSPGPGPQHARRGGRDPAQPLRGRGREGPEAGRGYTTTSQTAPLPGCEVPTGNRGLAQAGVAGGWLGLNYLGVCKGVRRKGWMELGLSSYDYAARVKVMACIHLPAASRTHLTRDTGTHPPPSISACPEDACQWISISRSVVPDSLRPHGLQPTRLVCP